MDDTRKYDKLVSEIKALRAKLADAGFEKTHHGELLSEVREKLAAAEIGLEESRLMSRQKADMLVMITHDLKSPLTTILGYSELIMTTKKGRDRRGYVRHGRSDLSERQ